MKVLFAVSNENISTQIVKKYQKEYKEIISYKNIYYFNAIVKELQRDKSYDRIVIGEDLEPFSSNNYDAIDKFIFEKLDNISDEATGSEGDIPIILLCSDRRSKSEQMLVKIFGLGIYNALLSPDKSLDNVCKLLYRPRSKKEAKTYYKIDSEEVNYQSENENNVSEIEIQNILKHYKRLGRDEDKYVESFNNIAAQYNDAQLRIISKFLPLNVKAILEEKSSKYQSIMTFRESSSTINTIRESKKKENGLNINYLGNNSQGRPTKPVIVPTAVNKTAKKLARSPKNKAVENVPMMDKHLKNDNLKPEVNISSEEMFEDINASLPQMDDYKENTISPIVEPVKRGRGRPRKTPVLTQEVENKSKRGRGRPRKNPIPDEEDFTLPGFSKIEEDTDKDDFQGFEDINEIQNSTLPGFDDISNEEENNELPGFDEEYENEDTLPGFDSFNEIENKKIKSNNTIINESDSSWNTSSNAISYIGNNNYSASNSRVNNLLSKDKKVVTFVGTTKNGTSFLVNNLGKTISNMGIKTAILDLTSNRNSYYIFTNNDERLRGIAYESIRKLRSGIASGISVDKNLDVYTALPGDKIPLEDVDNILATLVQNYSLVLLDCDFTTPADYFGAAQEIYIVQSLDILTIQPMTAFLRELKAKDILKEEKIRIVINKEVRIKGLTPNAIIGGLAFYNDPAMSFMTELFNKEKAKYVTIPFDESTYTKYLENVMECEISTNGYSREFNYKMKELSNMVYPLVGNKYKTSNSGYSFNKGFSSNMNNTLEQMKRNY